LKKKSRRIFLLKIPRLLCRLPPFPKGAKENGYVVESVAAPLKEKKSLVDEGFSIQWE